MVEKLYTRMLSNRDLLWAWLAFILGLDLVVANTWDAAIERDTWSYVKVVIWTGFVIAMAAKISRKSKAAK